MGPPAVDPQHARRYRYTAPSGWSIADTCDLATRWCGPGGDELVIHPARAARADELLAAIARGATLVEVRAPSSPCLARAWRGGDLAVVILDDGRFRYPIELRGGNDDVLACVVASVRLVPPTRAPLVGWMD